MFNVFLSCYLTLRLVTHSLHLLSCNLTLQLLASNPSNMLLDIANQYSYYQGDSLGHYPLSPSSSPSYSHVSYSYSPVQSPFTNSSDTFFTFPNVQHNYTDSKQEWRSLYEPQPPSPSSGYGYQTLYVPDSPLLSQSSSSTLEETLRYSSTTPADIPETVRFSSTSLNTDHGLTLYSNNIDQSFGHNLQFSNNSNSAPVNYQPSSNMQVMKRKNEYFIFDKFYTFLPSFYKCSL